jgi:16S rRNA (guanine966-N2)-methyltransferase
MRIVAGRWRGRRLKSPSGRQVRPTSDRVREAWMSIVQPALPDARVLDLFAGTGALGLEALSRGAAHVDFVEQAAASLRILNENIDALDARAEVTVHRSDVMRFVDTLAAGAYDVVFADPPYRQGFAERIAQRWTETPFAALLGIEHERGAVMPPAGDTRLYGDTAITFYRSPQ